MINMTAAIIAQSPRNNPQGPSSGSFRVGRGGGWNGNSANVRAANRGRDSSADRYDLLGFRLVSSPE